MRERILSVAERLFYTEGIRAVGVDRLIAEAGIAKATLYHHFSGKEELAAVYLRTRHERVIEALTESLATSDEPPRERLLKVFDMLAEKSHQPPFRGCAFLIAVAEQETSEPIIAIAREHKLAIKTIFLGICAELPVADASELATQIALCYEGALATFSVNRDPMAALVARRCAGLLIDAAVAPAKGAKR